MAADRIGRYRVVRQLGSGGTAEVYEGFDEKHGRPVAIKGLLADRGGPEHRERLRREALSVAALSHPAVAKIYETISDHDREWVVMELVPGRSLAEILARGPMTPAEVCRIGEQVASALAEAHRCGIIHRDVKAENVILTPDGSVKIIDFGFAKWQRPIEPNAAKLTADGVVVGTARAMSPEQATGKDVDHRTDIFSLGSLLYELASGRSPFRTATPLETMYRVARGEYVPLHRAAPGLPGTLVEIVETCMRPEPGDRFADADRLAAALRAFARAPDATPPPRGARRRPLFPAWAVRYWWVPVAAATLAGILALAE